MQSKTSLCDKTLFRKNLTRFFPVWALYTLGLLGWMVLTTMRFDWEMELKYNLVSTIADFTWMTGTVSAAGALLMAQALFGDLYNSRSCFALHALPIRRETWFGTNILSGLLFGLLPCLVGAPIAMMLVSGSCVAGAWQIPLYVAAYYYLQYLFSFGLAVLCIFCAGNRLGQLALYGMAQVMVAAVGLLVEAIYLELLPGVRIDSARYIIFCPLAWSAYGTSSPISFDVEGVLPFWMQEEMLQRGEIPEIQMAFRLDGEAWQYFGICALLGLGMLVLALLLYRRRNLECAGDFLANRKLELAFLLPFTFLVGCGAQGFYAYTVYEDDFGYFLFMGAGLFLGWFGGRMLLRRTTHVFTKKAFLGLGGLACAVALSLGLTWLDPLGIQTWVPDPEDVESVSVGLSNASAQFSGEELEDIISLHQMAMEAHDENISAENRYYEENQSPSTWVDFHYTMKDGTVIIRYYNVWVDDFTEPTLKRYASMPKMVFWDDLSLRQLDLTKFDLLEIGNRHMTDHSDPEDLQELWSCILADCAEGNMAQQNYFHTGSFQVADTEENLYRFGNYSQLPYLTLNLSYPEDGEQRGLYCYIYADCTHTIQWLTDQGILDKLGLTIQPEGEPEWVSRDGYAG